MNVVFIANTAVSGGLLLFYLFRCLLNKLYTHSSEYPSDCHLLGLASVLHHTMCSTGERLSCVCGSWRPADLCELSHLPLQCTGVSK
jgi:hypothetical protein